MATTPNTATDGVLWVAADMNTHTAAIKEMQLAGILLDLTSSAQADDTTGAGVAITGFTGSFTLTGNRRIEVIIVGQTSSSVANNVIQVNAQMTSLCYARSRVLHGVTGGPGQQDCNRAGLAAVLAAGTYSLTATLTRAVGTGTASLLSGARCQVLDIGAA